MGYKEYAYRLENNIYGYGVLLEHSSVVYGSPGVGVQLEDIKITHIGMAFYWSTPQ